MGHCPFYEINIMNTPKVNSVLLNFVCDQITVWFINTTFSNDILLNAIRLQLQITTSDYNFVVAHD